MQIMQLAGGSEKEETQTKEEKNSKKEKQTGVSILKLHVTS